MRIKNQSIVDRIDLLNPKKVVRQDKVRRSDVGYTVICGLMFYLATWMVFSL